MSSTLRVAQLVATLASLSVACLFPRYAPAGAINPTLLRQIFVPSIVKEDWHRSAFSEDGTLLLIAASERSFIVHVPTGRELRRVLLGDNEQLSWARARSGSYRWIGFTSKGHFVDIDGLTGATRRLHDVKSLLVGAEYGHNVSDEASFEFVSEHEIIAMISMFRERLQDGGSYRWHERILIRLHVDSGALLSVRRVSSDEFFVNSGGRLAVNPATGLVLLFDPTYTGNMALFRMRAKGRAVGQDFALVCSLGSGNPLDVHPHGDGLAVFLPDRVVLVSAKVGRSRDCSPPKSFAIKGLVSTVPYCKGQNGTVDKIVAVKRSSRTDEFIEFSEALDLFRIHLSARGCVARSRWTSVSEHFHPWRLARDWGTTPNRNTKSDSLVFSSAAVGGRHFIIAGGALVASPQNTGAAAMIVDLVGRPGGVIELDAAAGLLLGGQLLAPLKALDLATMTVSTIPYDYAPRYLQTSFLYQKPFAIVRALKAVATMDLDGTLRFRSIGTNPGAYPLLSDKKYKIEGSLALCASDDASRLYVTTASGELRILARDHPAQELRPLASMLVDQDVGFLFKIACNESGTVILADSLTDKVFVVTIQGEKVRLLQVLEDEEASSRIMVRPSLSRDALLMAVGPSLYARATIADPFVRISRLPGTERIIFERDGNRLLAAGLSTSLHAVRRNGVEFVLEQLPGDFGLAMDGAFLDADFVVLVRNAEGLDFVSLDRANSLGQLSFGDERNWQFTQAEGRLDAADLERNLASYWLMPDDPLRPLSPEIFMRDYFEPRLLMRLLECRKAEQTRPAACADEFKEVSALSELNRAQPEVQIASIAPEPGTSDEVAVTVKISGVEQSFGTDQSRKWQSGVYDLRLFRDGQLVRQAPALDEPDPSETLTPEAERARWRASSRLIEGLGSDTLTFRHIRLPGREAGDTVDFSAYAFNADRVKSTTARATHTMREALRRDRRAYVIAIGVSAFETEGWDLQFADDDARRLVEVLEPRLKASGRYKEVVSVPLLADWKRETGPRTITARTATKANVKAVLDILAGRSVTEEVRRSLPNEAQLRRALPDDLVLIAFASHGYADKAGNFYLFPYDIGEASGRTVTPQILRRAISSAELSTWLREVDAGELVMVVDACHSAASVENSEFKPGPMGARGLGQLAYDKGMRVLASTRANDVAWESPQTKQGLLSYALVQNGLVEEKADIRPRDGRIGIHEWLQYAVERVPQLYAEVVASRQVGDAKGPRLVEFDSETRSTRQFESVTRSHRPSIQQPSLFSYKRGEDSILLER